MVRFSARTFFVLVFLILSSASFASNVILLDEQFDGASAKFRAELKKGIKSAGFDLVEARGTDLASVLSQEQRTGSILILPDGRYLPTDAKKSIQEFLKRGNHLIVASGPAFINMVIQKDNKWLSKDDAKADLANLDGQSIVDFSREDLSRWTRYPKDPGQKAAQVIEKSGDPRVPDALHVKIDKLVGWDMYAGPSMTALPTAWKATVFWTKGGPNTPELSIEWREKDGTRWMKVIKLSPQWKQYVFLPSDFKYWSDKPIPGRGDLKDRFNPDNASSMAFGLSEGITNQKLDVSHEYWISDIRAVKDMYSEVDFSQPVIESLSPVTKTYRTTSASVQRVSTGEITPLNEEIVCSVPRARGFTFSQTGKYRFLPIVRALDKDGSYRGSAVHMLLNNSGDYARSVWGFVGFSQTYLEKNAASTVPLVVSMLRRIDNGVFLSSAGTEHFAYTDDETVKTGAYVTNLNSVPVSTKVDFTVLRGKEVVNKGFASSEASKLIEGPSFTLPAGQYTVKAVLSVNGKTIDAIVHEFRVMKYTGQDQSKAVSVSESEFILNGRPWRPLGTNYWPRYSVAQESGDPGLRWLAPEQYDPEMIEQDFDTIKKLGMNAISVMYTRKDEARNLMDVLARAENHGLKVNIYIPGLHPLEQNFRVAHSLIEAAHIPESPAVFAYDCGWEVHAGFYDRRKNYDGEWRQWVKERYGSVENALKDWSFQPELRDGEITGASDEQLKTDGPWRTYVAAYRRFWDDEISRKYREVREFIRSVDKYHLIGARSGYGGCGSLWIADQFPFDLASGARYLDFISPEAYNSSPDPSGFRAAGLTALYAKLVSGGKPVVWAEYGRSIWPNCDSESMEIQRKSYEFLLKAAIESKSRGAMAWWWPGGYRPGEESDYGIVNVDGSPRPSAFEISKIVVQFQQPDKPAQPDGFITIDRDKYTSGYAGVYSAHNEEYIKAVTSGKVPVLRTEGTGTTSADTPMIAVGDTRYNGHNPPKYLNAEFNYISINGKRVNDGDTIEVERSKPVMVEASMVNTAEAKWLAPKSDETGSVYLVVESEGEKKLAPITSDTPFLADASVAQFQLAAGLDKDNTYTFRMTAKGRMEFGDVVRVTVRLK